MKYSIKAIPTKYGGVIFRSRLEARWAAFFDLVGWKWQYEPFDLDGWAPDFRLSFPSGRDALIEVKPVASGADESIVIEAFKKCANHYETCGSVIILLGFEPNGTHLGWHLTPKSDLTYRARPYIKINLKHEILWRKAGNLVAYKPKR